MQAASGAYAPSEANIDPTTVTKVPANDPQQHRRGAGRTGVLRCGSVTARVRPWAHSEHTAFLIVNDQHPGAGEPERAKDAVRSSSPGAALSEWTATLSRWGYSRARTNAIGPDLAAWFSDGGFTMRQHLALLSMGLTGVATTGAGGSPGEPTVSTGRIRSCHGRIGALTTCPSLGIGAAILEVDRASFSAPWAFDRYSLRDALRATPTSRIFWVDVSPQAIGSPSPDHARQPRMAGFLIVGLAGRTSYIQRLAVHPDHRRAGVARTLMGRGVRWSRSRGCTQAVVNTEMDNLPALALYETLGFRRMDRDLRVMETAW